MLCFNIHTYHIHGVIFYQDKITFPQSSGVRTIFVGVTHNIPRENVLGVTQKSVTQAHFLHTTVSSGVRSTHYT